MRQLSVLIVAAASMLAAQGCVGRAVSEGLGAVTGPKGITIVIQPISSQKQDVALQSYTSFEMQPFTDSFGKTPPSVIQNLPGEFQRQLAKRRIPTGTGGKTLLIRGQIIHFENSTNVTSQAFGPFEEVIARVELVDKSTGNIIGVADCIGRSKETVNQGTPKKIEGLAEAIVGWISLHYPKPPKEER